MAQIGNYNAATAVVPTASVGLFDPTNPGEPDQRLTESRMADIPSVVKGFADDATIVVGAEVTNVRDISIQLIDGNDAALARAAVVHLVVFTTAAAVALSAGGSTGLAIDANGLILHTLVAKKVFLVKSDDAGLITLTWTDTGTDAAFLGVVLPDGRIVMSAALTNT